MSQSHDPAGSRNGGDSRRRQRLRPGQARVEEGGEGGGRGAQQTGPDEQEGGFRRQGLRRRGETEDKGDQTGPTAPGRAGGEAGDQRQAGGDHGRADDDDVHAAEDQRQHGRPRYGAGHDPAVQPGPSAEQEQGCGQHGQGGAGLHPGQAGQQGVIGVGALGPARHRPG